uniref:Protein-tyrosine-phosphatase n=1 Tax=Parastrongyloides trichosuri TaxID=131310 RepID=A0A0N4ZDP4_PARTI
MKLSLLYISFQLYLILIMFQLNSGAENNLFPSAPTGLPNGNITYSLVHESTSDVIMVKCPGTSYIHAGKLSKINVSKELSDKHSRQEPSTFVWYPVRNKNLKNNNYELECGSYNYSSSSDKRTVYWNINIMWKNPINISTDLMVIPSSKINADPMKFKCGKENDNLLIVGDLKNEGLHTFETIILSETYTKQLFYFFDKEKILTTSEIVVPCGVARIYGDAPKIIITDHKMYASNKNKEIYVIPSRSQRKRAYELKLNVAGSSDFDNFYYEEKVSVQRMKYRDEKVEAYNDANFETSIFFTVTGLEILKFSYSYLTHGGKYGYVSKTIFFGASNKKIILPFETIDIGNGKKGIQPNCSTERLSYGFLVAIEANNVITKVNSSIPNGKLIDGFKKNGIFFAYTRTTNNSQFVINCIYQTPDGTAEIRKVYIDKSTYIVHLDKNRGLQIIKKFKKEERQRGVKHIRESGKNFLTKVREKVGSPVFFGANALIGFIIVILSFLIYYLALRKILAKFFEEKRKRIKYPNIFHFWDAVTSQTLKEYSKIITDDKYLSEKVKTIKIIKHLENEDANMDSADNLFKSTLINSYGNINGLIKAYYVRNVSPKRTYIISDGPRNHAVGEFFKMLFMEDVGVVVAIVYKDFRYSNSNKKDVRYWPTKAPVVYGNLTVEPFEEETHKGDINVRFSFRLFYESKKPKKLTIFHVSDWKEYDLPATTKYLTELYKSVSECADKVTILVHNSQSVGPRVFIYTFFSCIFERMIEDDTIDNPMEIIKEIREKCFGGNITRIEFGYIVTALIKNFFEKGYLVGNEAAKLKFIEDFDTYMYESRIAVSNISVEFNEMLKFLWVSDRLKIAELINQCKRVQVDPIDVLEKKCQRHLAVSQSYYKDKLRYPGVYCLDNTAVYVSGFPKTDLRSFIHANEMIYDIGGGKKRKIIMCQAPVSTSIEDMLDVLYNYKVGIIVILVNPGELITKPPKWIKYLPTKEIIFRQGDYAITKAQYKPADNYNISEMNCKIYCNTDGSQDVSFRVYHYETWPDKSVPKKTDDVLKLLRRVMRDPFSDRHIVIHCSAGIGRTGTFALALLMIDTVQAHGWFNPIKSLDFLRKHRHRAVQTDSQFAFAIALVLHYFRKEIINIDKKLLDDFEKSLQIYFD